MSDTSANPKGNQRVAYFNGRIVPEREVVLPFRDRGFKYGDAALLDLFYFDLLAKGLWLAKRGMMALSIALDEADAGKLLAAVEEFAETRASLFAKP